MIPDPNEPVDFISWPAKRTVENSHEPNPTNVLWFSSQMEFPKVQLLSCIKSQSSATHIVKTAYTNWRLMIADLYKEGTPENVVRRKYKFWLFYADDGSPAYSLNKRRILYLDKPKQGLCPPTLEPLVKIFFEKHKPFIVNETMSKHFIKRRWDRATNAPIKQ